MARRAGGPVFFLTDYGLADEFAGVVRACVQRGAPGVSIIDLTHGVAPFDVRAGALALVRAVPYLGPGVVLAVVDPGVATARRAVAASVALGGGESPLHFVGPDNGLLPWAMDAVGGADRVVALPRHAGGDEGATFDGRDVFVPAAARLCRGAALSDLGDDVDPADLVRLEFPRVATGDGSLAAEVQWVDGFGNVQLAAGPDDASAAALGEQLDVEAGAVDRAIHRAVRVPAFAALAPGSLGVIVDANRHLALVCDRRSAATVLGVKPGDLVTLRSAATGVGAS